jgi:hypothetical protein
LRLILWNSLPRTTITLFFVALWGLVSVFLIRRGGTFTRLSAIWRLIFLFSTGLTFLSRLFP